jgi:hypothetical protein
VKAMVTVTINMAFFIVFALLTCRRTALIHGDPPAGCFQLPRGYSTEKVNVPT